MKIYFSINYKPGYGERLYISGSLRELGTTDAMKAIPMLYNGLNWEIVIQIDIPVDFTYTYLLINEQGEIQCEAGAARKFKEQGFSEYVINDEWKSFNNESPFLSTAFRKVFFNRIESISFDKDKDISIRVSANNIPSSSDIYICGSIEVLGCWSKEMALPMYPIGDGIWEIRLHRVRCPNKFEYKFIQKGSTVNGSEFFWEEGDNRSLEVPELNGNQLLIINHFSLNLPAKKCIFCGTAVPVFSIRGENDNGIGDFGSLYPIIDLLSITGQNVLQLLPVNDTTMTHTWRDSYPYGAISTYALHPLYLNLSEVGVVSDTGFMNEFKSCSNELNQLDEIDYDGVDKLKWRYIRRIYNQEWDKTRLTDGYCDFFNQNKEWLVPYAVFCSLRDKYGSPDYRQWPEYSIYEKDSVYQIALTQNELLEEVEMHYFIQYNLHLQLSRIHDYANKKRIILKGDIPIGVNRNSVEAWSEPELFNFDSQAGAPPDDFSIKGQNWNFPTYNWKRMESDDFRWWKMRFINMSGYFDAYRIDHILGFFRIWEIPADSVYGIMGHFNPALPYSKDEIENYGYSFDFERDCKPYIKEWTLEEAFSEDKDIVKEHFFEPISVDSYRFKRIFDTQKKLERFFSINPESDFFSYKDALMALYSEILFVQEPSDNNRYHPRISARSSKSYQALESWKKGCYDNLYDNYFFIRNNDFWYRCAMNKLPSLISSNGMLACGEDLGMIPACVPAVMKRLSILSLEIQRMPKDSGTKFGNTNLYPYLSVCSTSTHDTSTLRGWWEENKLLTSDYFHNMLKMSGDTPLNCDSWICREIIWRHLLSPSMIVIIPIQDWFSLSEITRKDNPTAERINVPSNPDHYWRYRVHIKSEDLIHMDEFTKMIRSLIVNSGRHL